MSNAPNPLDMNETSDHADVLAFHQYFKLPVGFRPTLLDPFIEDFRVKFMHEELREFQVACAIGDLPGAADALIDLAYVVHGTAVMMGLPWERLWNEVHQANMRKVNVLSAQDSKRNSVYDVKKPPGWVGPDITGVLAKAVLDSMEDTP